MRIDKSRWSEEELMVFETYRHMCVLCGFQYADTLHHEPPRSLNPRWIDEPWTQFPLCAAHHDAVTVMPREEALELLLAHVDIFFPGAIEKVKETSKVVTTQP
jgi:5-methylcytosine-specific restriction endonuclease McrA